MSAFTVASVPSDTPETFQQRAFRQARKHRYPATLWEAILDTFGLWSPPIDD